MEKSEKLKYTYSTDPERLKQIKILAVEKNIPTNAIIDEAIDAYFGSKKSRKNCQKNKKNTLS